MRTGYETAEPGIKPVRISPTMPPDSMLVSCHLLFHESQRIHRKEGDHDRIEETDYIAVNGEACALYQGLGRKLEHPDGDPTHDEGGHSDQAHTPFK